MKKIDDLFRDKLQNHQVNPSPDLWKKLEENLHTRQRSSMKYWSAAAVVTILCGMAYLFIQISPLESQKQDAQAHSMAHEAASNEISQIIEPALEEIAVNDNHAEKTKFSVNNQQPVKKPKINPTTKEEKIIQKKEPEEENKPLKELVPIKAEVQVTEVEKVKEKISLPPVIIIYEPESTEDDIKTLVASDFENEEDPKGIKEKNKFQQIIDITKEFKNGNIGLARLREAKEELFAIDRSFK
jgi:type IV secretory pathway VirB10-like protein